MREHVELSGMTVTDFSEKMGYTRTAVYKLFQKVSVDSNVLYRASRVLNCDLFAFYSQELKDVSNRDTCIHT